MRESLPEKNETSILSFRTNFPHVNQQKMAQYQQILKEHKIVQSMSRKGSCLDNCIMENFFGRMRNEMFYGHEYEFKSLDELKKAMEEYLAYYNTEQIQVR